MLITVPTYSEAIARVRARIRNNRPDISTLPGSVNGDVFVVPQALSDVQQQALTYYTAVRQALLDLLALKNDPNTIALIAQSLDSTASAVLQDISDSIDRYASNFSEVRKGPVKASGIALLGRSDAPAQDLSVGIGVVARASNGQQFITTGTAIMYAAVGATYFNSDLQLYVIAVPVEATVAGSAGNVVADSLVSLVTPVNGLPLVTNTSNMDLGRDRETDEDFVQRILDKWQAAGKITPAGIRSSITDAQEVGDLYLARPQTSFALRGFGRTDLWVKDRVPEQVTETFSAFNHPTIASALKPTQGPALSLVSVSSGAAFLQTDATSVLQGSVQALDAIRFTTLPVFPVTVTYLRNKRVNDCQEVFNDDTLAPLNYRAPVDVLSAIETPILVRQAPILDVDYTVTIVVLPGRTKSKVVSDVQANLLAFSETLLLGQIVYKTDLNDIVERTVGVLRIAGEPSKFSPSNMSGVLDSVTPDANEAVTLSNINVF